MLPTPWQACRGPSRSGKSTRFGTIQRVHEPGGGIADTLGRIYGLTVLRAASAGYLDEATAIASKLDDLLRCYREVEGFQPQEHGSALLMANTTINAVTAEHQCDYENALVLYNTLLESPYIKCSGSGRTIRWLVGTAYTHIGRILFLYQWRVQDAIPFLQNAVRYCDQDDEQLQEAQSLLEDAMSQPPLPPQLTATLDVVRSAPVEMQARRDARDSRRLAPSVSSSRAKCHFAGYALR